MKLNVPNKLTMTRMFCIPVLMVFLCVPAIKNALGDLTTRSVAAALFILIALTDLLDGKIARKYHLVTDFGKFMDPLADKMLILGACLGILCYCPEYRTLFVWITAILLFRELAVTGLRLLVAGSREHVVVAASWLGKVKTTTQIICLCTLLLEPVLFGSWCDFFNVWHPLSYLTMALMTVMTVWSGLDYGKTYWKYLNPEK